MRMSTAGLAATLVRTKTSGAGKNVEALPMFVSSEAFLKQQTWLTVGFDLWQNVPLERDFFLCLPTRDWQGARLLQARYADGFAMSRGLTSKLTLRQEDGSALVLPAGAECFWSEHSEKGNFAQLCGHDELPRHMAGLPGKVGGAPVGRLYPHGAGKGDGDTVQSG